MTLIAVTLTLVVFFTAPRMCFSQIELSRFIDEFDISVGGIKIFQHNDSHPMIFVGKGKTDFVESKGNFQVKDFVTSRIPLQYHDVISYVLPYEIKLYRDSWDESIDFVQFRIMEDQDHALVLEITEVNGNFDRLWIRVVATEGEKVWGGGEQFSYFNLRGQFFPIWTREQGIGRNKSTLTTFQADQRHEGAGGDYHTTYFPQPTFISDRGYYLHHEGPDYTILDFTQADFHEIFLHTPRSGVGRLRIQNGNGVAGLLDHMTAYLGRQPRLPDWIHNGAVLGLQGGTQQVLGRFEQSIDHGVAVSAVWIQDWVGNVTTFSGQLRPFWNWELNQQRYPDLLTEIGNFRNKGIRVLGYVNPYLDKNAHLFQVAESQGYLVKNSTNQTYMGDLEDFLFGIVDLTNPQAVEWFKNDIIKKNMIELGFSGWMADLGEFLPVNGVSFHSGQSALELHNQWPLLWATLNRQAVQEAGREGDIVFWMRAGWTGSANYSTLMWAGDQNVDWSLSDGLASTVTAALSLAMSDVALTHFDIGGFTTFGAFNPPLVRSEPLLLRSAEMAIFTPIFRTHEGSQPMANVQFYTSRGTLLKFARLSRMFAALKPYTSHVVNTSSVTGLPAQRPLFLQYPHDTPSYDVKYQYLYGEDLMVAPVYLPDVDTWDVYLPRDPNATWVFLWDESIVSSGGETVKVPAPLGHPPVFFRSSSAFVGVFRVVATEPLVDLPAYVPRTETEAVSGHTAPSECNGSSESLNIFPMLFFLVLSRLVI